MDNSGYCNPLSRVVFQSSQPLHVEEMDCHRSDVFFSFHHHRACHKQSMRTNHPTLHLEAPELEWNSLINASIKSETMINKTLAQSKQLSTHFFYFVPSFKVFLKTIDCGKFRRIQKHTLVIIIGNPWNILHSAKQKENWIYHMNYKLLLKRQTDW